MYLSKASVRRVVSDISNLLLHSPFFRPIELINSTKERITNHFNNICLRSWNLIEHFVSFEIIKCLKWLLGLYLFFFFHDRFYLVFVSTFFLYYITFLFLQCKKFRKKNHREQKKKERKWIYCRLFKKYRYLLFE